MEPHSPLQSDEARGRAIRNRPVATGTPRAEAPAAAVARGLRFERYFTTPGVDPFDTVEWELRNALISNEKGEKVFEQKDVEMPKFWSQTATNVVVSKYFRGQLGSPDRERSVRQLIGRVVDTVAAWGRGNGYFASEEDAQTVHAEL
jgi:ribonucleoside-diphosphate reductase alpha chain